MSGERERLAAALYPWMLRRPNATVEILDALLPLVRAMQAEAVREFAVEAADHALVLGRRGPNAIADWLLDLGQDHAAALRATTVNVDSTANGPESPQSPETTLTDTSTTAERDRITSERNEDA